jgi:serine phosphatase RsbU (regulator of sigma subunit)
MKLSFLGLAPTPELSQVLSKNKFAVSLPKAPDSAEIKKADLVAVYISKESALEKVALVRKANPNCWIAVLIDKKSLSSSDFQEALLACEEKNAVWIKETWEESFWISFQQFLQWRKLQQKVTELESSSESLSQESAAMVLRLEKNVQLAEDIQRSLLPRFSPNLPGISISAKYVPASGLGGDYYDLFEFGDRKRCGFLLADSKSHGMAAALLSVLLKLRLDEMKERFPDSKTFIEHIDREIQTMNLKNIASMSLLYGILDRSSLTFQYTSAGELAPIHLRQGKTVKVPAPSNRALGGGSASEFHEHTLTLKPGDVILLHTDGIAAPLGVRPEEAPSKLAEILSSKKLSMNPVGLQNELLGRIDHYTEKQKLPDDLTLIHLSIDEKTLYVAQG